MIVLNTGNRKTISINDYTWVVIKPGENELGLIDRKEVRDAVSIDDDISYINRGE